MGNFYRHLAIFSGHTGSNNIFQINEEIGTFRKINFNIFTMHKNLRQDFCRWTAGCTWTAARRRWWQSGNRRTRTSRGRAPGEQDAYERLGRWFSPGDQYGQTSGRGLWAGRRRRWTRHNTPAEKRFDTIGYDIWNPMSVAQASSPRLRLQWFHKLEFYYLRVLQW